MRLKNLLFILAAAVLLVISACTDRSSPQNGPEKITTGVCADYPWYDSVEALYEKADLIVQGKVHHSRVEWMNHRIEPTGADADDPVFNPGGEYGPQEEITTIYTVEVHEVYKGSADETIELLQPGGETDTVICICPEAAEIETGMEYVLFLSGSVLHENAFWLVSPAQAVYRVGEDSCPVAPKTR